jgi:integrase
MKINALTDSQVRGAKAGNYTDGQNLFLRVSPSSIKTWTFKFKNGLGKSTAIAIGQYPKVGLADARAIKERMIELVGQGMHPKLALQSDGPVETFGDVAKLFLQLHSQKIKLKDALKREVDVLLPVLGNMRIADVKPHHVISAIQPTIARGSLVSAGKLCTRSRQIVDHACLMGILSHNQLAQVAKLLPKHKVQHQRALRPDQLGDLMVGLENAEISIVTRNLAKWVLLTATRANESSGARWSEIDIENRVWEVPASRMKMAQPHKIPLSDGAMKILETMQTLKQNDFVFPGRAIHASANPASVTVALGRIRPKLSTTQHGLRALFSTYCHERSEFSSDVIEASLSHRIGNAIKMSYLRSTYFDKRVELMAWWDAEVAKAGATVQE